MHMVRAKRSINNVKQHGEINHKALETDTNTYLVAAVARVRNNELIANTDAHFFDAMLRHGQHGKTLAIQTLIR
jgi:hypothetical protein